jgi:hypothetical protein
MRVAVQHVAPKCDVPSIKSQGFRLDNGYHWAYGPGTYFAPDGDRRSEVFYVSNGRNRKGPSSCRVIVGHVELDNPIEASGGNTLEIRRSLVDALGGPVKVARWFRSIRDTLMYGQRDDTCTADAVRELYSGPWDNSLWVDPFLGRMAKEVGHDALIIYDKDPGGFGAACGGNQIVLFYPEKFVLDYVRNVRP